MVGVNVNESAWLFPMYKLGILLQIQVVNQAPVNMIYPVKKGLVQNI
jgi:hypothetical protein